MLEEKTWSNWLKGLTLEEKVGQLIMGGFPGPEVGPGLERLIRDYHFGGVIIFARNVASPGQLAKLTANLQETAQARRGIPLFVAIDQEGGIVARLVEGAAVPPGNMGLGATGKEDLVYRAAAITARQLRAVGVNVNFAPVLDVNNNPANPVIGVRSFGESPEEVSRLGVAAVRGYQENGILATGKHFPGHGDTALDSHLALPTIPHPRDRLEAVELAPFRAAIAAGLEAIMTAHVTFPAIDPTPGRPATLSYRVLTELLREEMGFGGIIFTDCMEMKAIADNFGTEEAAVLAIQAGADIVLVSHSYDRQVASYQALLAAVRTGKIGEERIDQSVERILRLKSRYLFWGQDWQINADSPRPSQGLIKPDHPGTGWASSGAASGAEAVATSEELEFVQQLYDQSITLVKNEGHLLPIPKDGHLLLVSPQQLGLTMVEDRTGSSLKKSLEKRGPTVREVLIPGDITPERPEWERALTLAPQAAAVIFASQNGHLHHGQMRLARAILALNRKFVLVALRNPYDLMELPEAPAFLATYGYRQEAMESVARIIFGEVRPQGRLPVSLPGLYPVGHGLTF